MNKQMQVKKDDDIADRIDHRWNKNYLKKGGFIKSNTKYHAEPYSSLTSGVVSQISDRDSQNLEKKGAN